MKEGKNNESSKNNRLNDDFLIPEEIIFGTKTPEKSSSKAIKTIVITTAAGILLLLGVSQMKPRKITKDEQNIPVLPSKTSSKPTIKPIFRETKESGVERKKHEWAAFQNEIGRTILFHQGFWEGNPGGKASITKQFKDLIPIPDTEVSTSFVEKGENEKMHIKIEGKSLTIEKAPQGFEILKGEKKLKEVIGKAKLTPRNTIHFQWEGETTDVPRAVDAPIGQLGINEIGEIACYYANPFEINTGTDTQNRIVVLYFKDKKTGRMFETRMKNGYSFSTTEKGSELVFQTTLAKVGASYTIFPGGKSKSPSDNVSRFLWKGGSKWTAIRIHIQNILKEFLKESEQGN